MIRSRWTLLLIAIALVGWTVFLRYPTFQKAIWNLDEASTFTMGEAVLHGEVLYRDAADNRAPLVPYLKAALFAVIGSWNLWGAHVAVALMLGLTAVLLWLIGRRLGDGKAGLWGAFLFTLLNYNLLNPLDAFTAHVGWFLIFFSALGVWLFTIAFTGGGRWPAVLAGAAFGLSFLCKQPGLFDFGVTLVLCVIILAAVPDRRRELRRTMILMVAAFAAVFGAAIVYFAANHALHDFFFYAWTYNTKYYVPEVPFWSRLAAVRMPFVLAWLHMPVVLFLGVAAAVALLWRVGRNLPRERLARQALPLLILGWVASGLVTTALSGRTFDHYSIQVIPGLSLACGWLLARWQERVRAAAVPTRRRAGWALLFLPAAVMTGHLFYDRAQLLTSGDTTVQLGAYLRNNSSPDARIFVWGYVPEVYVFAHRLPATRFFYTNWLTGLIPWTNLDPLKNTDYAVVPGAWAQLWQDFDRHPPAFIVDTGVTRGYAKYPLNARTKLWDYIQRDYAQVEPVDFPLLGFKVYQRLQPVTAAPLPAGLPASSLAAVSGPDSGPSLATDFTVELPVSADRAALYLDGKLYRQIDFKTGGPHLVAFTVLAEDLPAGLHRLVAVEHLNFKEVAGPVKEFLALGDVRLHPPANSIFLDFHGHKIYPLASSTFDGKPIVLDPNWHEYSANAPSQVSFPRLADMETIVMRYGIAPGAYDFNRWPRTDGVGVVVEWQSDAGERKILFNRELDPVADGRDQGLQTSHFLLSPKDEGGRLIFMFTPGPRNDTTADWSYWHSLEAEPLPMMISFRDERIFPSASSTPFGVATMDERGMEVAFAGAPAHFDFPLEEGMARLDAQFGMLDQAWTGPKKTDGAWFEIDWISPEGKTAVLFNRFLDPAHKPADRGLQKMTVLLPQPAHGTLRFLTRGVTAKNNAFAYTYWRAIDASDYPVSLAFNGQPVASIGSNAKFGFGLMQEDNRPVLLSPIPSTITFLLQKEMRSVEADFGFLHGAYSDGNHTDGARFIVELVRPDGATQELFRQALNPVAVEADRGYHHLSVNLPADAQGKLVFRVEPRLIGGSPAYGWSFWANLAAH